MDDIINWIGRWSGEESTREDCDKNAGDLSELVAAARRKPTYVLVSVV